jgi:iron complex outermembrane receptor protein
MNLKINRKLAWLGSAALSGAMLLPAVAFAQDAVASGIDLSDTSSNAGLSEIVVTAQRREQSVQDVPIAVTALNGETLQANRVVNVADLSGLAPGVTVRTAAGGSSLPQFGIRGAVSTGTTPGSDKEVSIYLDGV